MYAFTYGRLLGSLFIVLLLSACGSNSPSANSPNNVTLSAEATCVADSPWLEYGEGLQASSPTTIPQPAAASGVQSVPACDGNGTFQFAAAKTDITGPAGGKIHMGNESPENFSAGIYMRQYARTFIVHSPCNNKRVVLAITDTGMLFESVRKAVLDLIAADPELAPHYNQENIMMNATHTHSTPGGQAHFTAYNALRFGHDPQT
ncbi:MAG: neutral/alkaline non-lysosomal ceramidase N-terminal domain-containing protein, partial [Gammaproteobacteria bacterium]|nr:neutral/alkaline non-lysosomal ceramidase N-terminal domain-containing protein [Gammaproteobacteria bacterium]